MVSPQAEAGESARSRIAWRLLPFLFLLYVANYLDRTNIAYATLGMKGDLGLSDSVFGTASGIFFIGYFALQIPGALLVERWSARLLLAITLIAWGGLTTLTAFVHTPHQLYCAPARWFSAWLDGRHSGAPVSPTQSLSVWDQCMDHDSHQRAAHVHQRELSRYIRHKCQ